MADKNTIIWSDRKHFMWFPFSFTKYSIRNERLYEEKGLLKTHYDEVLLYRIIDVCLERTLAQKLFGTGTVILYTKADSDKEIRLENIKNPKQVKEKISELVEEVRNAKNVVGKEFYHDHITDDAFDVDEE